MTYRSWRRAGPDRVKRRWGWRKERKNSGLETQAVWRAWMGGDEVHLTELLLFREHWESSPSFERANNVLRGTFMLHVPFFLPFSMAYLAHPEVRSLVVAALWGNICAFSSLAASQTPIFQTQGIAKTFCYCPKWGKHPEAQNRPRALQNIASSRLLIC